MDVYQAITKRRSIRRFEDKPVPQELLEKLLESATLAPSPKNIQPWRFVVLQGSSRNQLVELMRKAISDLIASGVNVANSSAANSAIIIAQAPVTVLIYDPFWKPADDHNGMGRIWSLVDTQAVGAAIQNMLLTAEELGLGSLWICDVLMAESLISGWLGCQDELVAAVSFGYPAEAPAARPRKPWQELTTWFE